MRIAFRLEKLIVKSGIQRIETMTTTGSIFGQSDQSCNLRQKVGLSVTAVMTLYQLISKNSNQILTVPVDGKFVMERPLIKNEGDD